MKLKIAAATAICNQSASVAEMAADSIRTAAKMTEPPVPSGWVRMWHRIQMFAAAKERTK